MSWKHDVSIRTGPEIALLGPVTIGGASITKSQRAVISALVLHQECGATADAIADFIWGSRVPSSARASVQNQIARLRNTFGAQMIHTQNDRYHLRGTTDITRFELKISPWLRQPLNKSAIPALTAALELWRGRPFEDIDENVHALVERTRVEHLRGLAVERLAIARLLQDQFTLTIGELLVRTRAAPFHERAWELLMIALYISGRRTEALQNYAEFENLLDTEFAAKPSLAIRRLRGVIALDETLDVIDSLRMSEQSVADHHSLHVLATA